MIPAFSASQDSVSVGNILVSVVGRYTLDALLDSEQRRQHKEQCAERLAAQDNMEVQYAEQAVLANLDWGIDALEEAIGTSNAETKKARLEHAEKMLQVCALLDKRHTTAGVPNSYLSAWAHLNLAFVWKLRNDDMNAAAHMLEMFLVEPLYSRVDFAPGLWEHLFLPHLNSIVGWYTEQRHEILSSALPDRTDFSFSREDLSYNDGTYKSLLSSVSPEQAAQLQQLEQMYQDSLDENTRLYARYYKDGLNFDPAASTRKSMPLMPIAEPPMTPMHELGHIPQSVKFGPQPPTSAGFSHSNFGVGMERSNSSQASNMYADGKSRSEDAYRTSQGCQNPIWEEGDESEDFTYGETGSVYNVNMQITSKRSSQNQHSPDYYDSPQVMQAAKGNLSDPNDYPYSRKGNSINEVSPKEKFSSPSKVPNLVRQSSKASRLHRSSKGRNRSSKPLLELFRDPVAMMLSSPQSTSSVDESSSSLESELDVEEEIQQKGRDYAETSMGLKESYNIVKEEDEEDVTDEEEEVEEGIEADSNFRSPVSIHGECSSSMIVYEEDPGQNLSLLKLPEISNPVTRPPKDFVCPITSQIFNDPVTLETGQTYERRAIQEWLDRGNTTCPITRQTLRSTSLPSTNYVLKRVIASWKEQHPELALEFGSTDNSPCPPRTPPNLSGSSILFDQTMPEAGSPDSLPSNLSSDSPSSAKGRLTQRFNRRASVLSSPITVISQDSLEGLVSELKPAIGCICTSDDLQECESAVLTIAQIWQDSMGNPNIQVHLTKERVIKGFMEVLSTSINVDILAATLYILSELISRDDSVWQTIGREDPDYDYVVGLLKRGMVAATVLLYQLRPTSSQLAFCDLLPSLVSVLRQCDDEDYASEGPFQMCIGPKEAAALMIDQMLTAGDENTKSMNAHSVISMEGISPLVDSLEANNLEERVSAVSILLYCMQADGSCRNYIAHRAQLTPVLELLHSGSERARMVTIAFLSELVRLNRRSINNQLLQVIKEEGTLSTMHIVLVHLQMVPLEQRPVVAGFLLQLDLLTQPRKGSMYREEAVEALIGALSNEDIFISQVAAAETIVALGGRFSYFGKPLMEAWLLKCVGLDQSYNALMRSEHQVEGASPENLEEENKAAKEWEKRVAGALVNFENGTILDALCRGMKSKAVDLSRLCTVAVTWLVHMLPLLPDTGVQERARKSLMILFIQNLRSSKDMEDKALAVLALRSFIDDPEGVQELVRRAKDICRPLRQLKRSILMASDILKTIINNASINSPEFWTHEELGPPTDAIAHGEVRCLAQSRGRLFSGHSDGTLKVWDCKKKNLTLIQDIKEHSKSVTSLYIASPGDKLYSGSLDRTIRVWAIGPEEIHCLKSHDTKEPVQNLTVNSTMFCFVPQGTGVRVHHGEAGTKPLNGNKHVQSIALTDGKLFCGCTDNSIQELDLGGGPPVVIQQGVRTLLGKKAIYALQVFNGMLYSAGSLVDGVAAKVWNLLDKSLVGHLPTSTDIRAMVVSDDFIHLGSSSGSIEVWLRERLVKVTGMNVGSKVTSLLIYDNVLFCGSEDGKIRGWAVS